MEISEKIIPPENGWEEQAFYLVSVSFNSGNPIHGSIFYTGFLNDRGEPSGYNMLLNPTYEGRYPISSVRYLKAERKLTGKNELDNLKQ